jgi:hypothetical protein
VKKNPYYVHNQSTNNAVCGIMERVYFVKDEDPNPLFPGLPFKVCPRPHRNAFRRMLGPTVNQLRRLLPHSTPWSHQEFVASYAGQGRKQMRYAAAAEELKLQTYPDSYYARMKSFIKYDKVHKKRSAPRLIQPRTPHYNIKVGRFLRKIEKRILKSLNKLYKEQTNVVLKGYNAKVTAERIKAKWDKFRDPVFIGLDASRFDQHVSVDALKFEHSVYLQCFRGDDRTELAKLLRLQLKNIGRMYMKNCTIKYEVEGNRMSGDMNTGLGNILIMCVLCRQFATDVALAKYEYINNGDDCGFIVERDQQQLILENLDEWFAVFGFEMKVEGVFDSLYSILFCQCQLIETQDGPVMVRSFPNSMYKDLVSVKPLKNKGAYDKHRKAISDCGLSLTDGVPVYNAFYRMLARGAGDIADRDDALTGMSFMASNMTYTNKQISPQARYTFWRAFGVLPDEQIAMERELDRMLLSFDGDAPKDISEEQSIFYTDVITT